MTATQSGLANITAGQSAIATVGQGAGLSYRGYSIEDLAAKASFEEVAYLLLYEHLPKTNELERFTNELTQHRSLPKTLINLLEQIPKTAHPMDVLRTACSMLGTLEPETNSSKQHIIATRLLAIFPAVLAYWYQYHYHHNRIHIEAPYPSIAEYFLRQLLQRTADDIEIKVINTSLILYAEHEFNASTFAARVTCATGADFYSAITSAIGTLSGPLHGGANEAALELIQKFKTPDEAEQGILNMLKDKQKIMGFGHRVYQKGDPRSPIIKTYAKQLAEAKNSMQLFNIAERIEKVMWDKKKLFPNLDFYSAIAYHCCGIPTDMFTPIFVLARTAGWSAHIIEQRSNNKLIRPVSEYIGPKPQKFIAINQR